MRRQKLTVAHHAPNAVGIAIGDQAEIRSLALEFVLAVNVIALDGFGVESAKIRVMVGVKCTDGAFCAFKNLIETTGPYPEKCLMSKMKF